MQNTHKGSITVEAIVMLGLIATLTPILYKHVAERRQDIDNINEANTLLLLKNAAAEYIEANKENLNVGATVLSPADIGVDISGYRIGIRKDSSGKIDAMIAASGGGNDLRAGKIASLLSVSAGIYSAQNLTKAWGINGVWAEDISNYGFTSLPTGIPVITTAYDKEDASGLNEEQLKEFIENTTFDKLASRQLCLNDVCIADWEELNPSDVKIILKCNEQSLPDCADAYNRSLNRNCMQIALSYQRETIELPEMKEFRLTSSASVPSSPTTCYFPSTGKGYNSDELIYQCYRESNADACRVAGSEIEPICNDIKAAYGNLSKGTPASGNYTVYWDGAQTSYCDMAKTPAWTKVRDFTHGTTYTYNLPRPGKYRFEAYGGRGTYNLGGYTWGIFTTETTPQFFIIVGSRNQTSSSFWGSGGGGTEIRYGFNWQLILPMASGTHPNNYLRDKYRIMVAGGAGAAGDGGGGNNCGGGVNSGCKGVGGSGITCSRCVGGGIGQPYMYGQGSTEGYDGTLYNGSQGWLANNPISVGYEGGKPSGGFGGGGDVAAGAGGDGYGGGASSSESGGGGGYGGSGWDGGGGYGGGGHSSGGGGGGGVCLASMPSGWPACSRDIFVFDEGGGTTGGNTTANGGTSDGNGIFRIWILEK